MWLLTFTTCHPVSFSASFAHLFFLTLHCLTAVNTEGGRCYYPDDYILTMAAYHTGLVETERFVIVVATRLHLLRNAVVAAVFCYCISSPKRGWVVLSTMESV